MVPSTDRNIDCPECGKSLSPGISSPPLAMFSMASAEQKAHILRTRSEKHTQKIVTQEAEKFKHGAGIERVMKDYKKPRVGYTGSGKGKKTKK